MPRNVFERVSEGENPNGFRAVTPNGTASDRGEGDNHQYNWGPNINGPRWAMPEPEPAYALVGAIKPMPRGRQPNRNRTAE